jgi:hypothetical protein
MPYRSAICVTLSPILAWMTVGRSSKRKRINKRMGTFKAGRIPPPDRLTPLIQSATC